MARPHSEVCLSPIFPTDFAATIPLVCDGIVTFGAAKMKQWR
jgi:hypothetical protein